MFDPLTRKLTHTIQEAHMDCVNGAKYVEILAVVESGIN